MQEKITFSQLCNLVAARTSVSRKVTEAYLRAFFSALGDGLASSETVKIKGLGTFKITKIAERRSVNVSTGQEIIIPSHNRISFVPSADMARAVNAPFSAFEAVELADSFTDAELAAFDRPEPTEEESADSNESYSEVDPDSSEAQDAIQELPEPTPVIPDECMPFEEIVPPLRPEKEEPEEVTYSPEVDTAVPPVPDACFDSVSAPADGVLMSDNVPESAEDSQTPPKITPQVVAAAGEKRKMRFTFWGGFCSALALVTIVGGIIILFLPEVLSINPWPTKIEHKLETSITKLGIHQQETSEAVPFDEEAEKQGLTPVTEPGVEANAAPGYQKTDKTDNGPVYDTITKTRYLTTMAKEHYGNYHFWPYIYEENKAFLGHPDRIKPGTQVVVPPLSKYGVDPANPEDVREAKRKGVAIYARYRK